MEPLKRVPLDGLHRHRQARMTAFAGWDLPLWYTSILEEHQAVRSRAGIFDVSNMGRVWLTGGGAGVLLDRLLTRPVRQLAVGSSRLCLLCLESGGILDDLWVYRLQADRFLIVCNAAGIERKLDWLRRWSGSNPDVSIEDRSADTVMLAVQGPAAHRLKNLAAVSHLAGSAHTRTKIAGRDVFVSRTGYTGEDGFELITDAANAVPLWESFIEQGVKPCGLGARDSLRLEAGRLLYGQDIDTGTNPFEAGLGWLVDLDRDNFIGRASLLSISRRGVRRRLVGFQMSGREIARSSYLIFKFGKEVGRVTSGGYAPTLEFNIGLGYVPAELATIGGDIKVMIRDKLVMASIVSRKFYRRGARNEPQGI